MLSRITSLITQAAEATTQALLGPTSRYDEFQVKWKEITALLMSDNEDELAQCASRSSVLLQDMVSLLCEEEDDKDDSMGPCFEYVLQHKLLDTLVTTCKSDYPQGMRKVVLNFFAVLLERVRQPLLPHITVHQSVNRLIATCGRSSSNPLAKEEIQFLKVLCKLMHQSNTLASFFIENTKGGENVGASKFTVLEALMRLTNSEDHMMCLKAFDCLLRCISVTSDVTTPLIATSQLPVLLASKLQHHLHMMSSSLSLSQVLTCSSELSSESHVPSQQGSLQHVTDYLFWLDYCQRVTATSSQIVCDAVCTSVGDLVCRSTLQPKLTSTCEDEYIVSAAVLTRSLQVITEEKLQNEFLTFIFTDVWTSIVQRCDHISETVCVASLTLVHTLLMVPNASVLPHILPTHSWDSSLSSTLHRDMVDYTVMSYLSIPSTSLLSASEVTGDTGVRHYLMEASVQVAECLTATTSSSSSSSTTTTTTTTATTTNTTTATTITTPLPISTNSVHDNGTQSLVSSNLKITEDVLSAVLMNRLERMLDQSYEVNLVLTAVLARLACYNASIVDEYLFSCTNKYPRTVYSVLSSVSSKLHSHANRSPGLLVNIVEARRRLVGEPTSDLLSMPHNQLLEGAIILEEFSKEIAAILYIKHYQTLLTLPQANT